MILHIFQEFFKMLINFIYFWIVGCIKALLPRGFLPRKRVRGQVVLITGSGSGLGRLLAIKFGELGAIIVLWDINEKLNMETKEMLNKTGVEVFAYTIDLSNRQQIYEVANRVRREIGDVDILINNAGIVWGKTLLECPDDLIEKTMAVNANALFYTAKTFLPAMIAKMRGHIVTISSLAGLFGMNNMIDYCASKHAAVGFSESLRSEMFTLEHREIQVTTVCPYYMSTGMFDGVKTYSPRLFPILNPEDVADRIVEAILTNAEELYLPAPSSHLMLIIKGFLPTKAAMIIGQYLGMGQSMKTFRGRN